MAKETVHYKRTVKGSVGAGIGALFNGSGRQYYILEHKNSSKFHCAGESQKIIIDQAELGRDTNCQVRFDDSFETVSRRHAAIVKDGNGWKLVHLSNSNPTYLNGKRIDEVNQEWFLQNGDEIQLATNGPKLGFIIPAGKQSLVSSIKLTERLNLFRQQALKPYKTAIASLCACLIIITCISGYAMFKLHINLLSNKELITEMLDAAEKKDSIYTAKMDSIGKIRPNVIVKADESVSKLLEEVKPYVYYIESTFYITLGDKTHRISTSQGTGFLLSDGRFVTARHCVQPWLFNIDEYNAIITTAKETGRDDVTGYAIIEAQSMNDSFRLSSNDFIINDAYDKVFRTQIDGTDAYVTAPFPISFQDGTHLGEEKMMGNDWAYANVGKVSKIKANVHLSSNLRSGATVHVLGFPSGLGKADGKTDVEPIYNKMLVSRDGVNNADCIMVTEGVAHGNSGGPVFIINNNHLEVVAIVSRKESATQQMGTFGIIQQQQQYDHLVPLANIK